ncbi:histone H1A-like [Calliphora vicina]|uniref:histone H1A-like n=1 Tax=Calliphora vicina TaxID=7373 RepID=UPI00325A6489
MNTNDTKEQTQYETSSSESNVPFIPITPKSSEEASYKEQRPQNNKPVATKTMMQRAIKALSTNSRKGFSLAGIRKYILQNFLHTAGDLKHRMPFMKKFFKAALETGEVVSVKGTGLTGSFRVPPTSPLHENAKKNKEQNEKKLKKKTAKTIVKQLKTMRGPALKPKKVKKVKRIFSAQM